MRTALGIAAAGIIVGSWLLAGAEVGLTDGAALAGPAEATIAGGTELAGALSAAAEGVGGGGAAEAAAAEAAEAAEGGLAETCNCFEAGTQVETSNGLQPIEKIKVGDLVQAEDAKTGALGLKPVLALIPGKVRVIWDLRIETRSSDGHKLVETIHTTEEHPFRTVDGHWTPAAQLKAGTSLVTDAGSEVKVVSVAQSRHTARTYNLEVADYHTYFVGNERVLVHNACELMEAVTGLRNKEVIARGRGIRDVQRLVSKYGGRADQWRKMKGVGELNGRTGEFHWYQNVSRGIFEGKPKYWP